MDKIAKDKDRIREFTQKGGDKAGMLARNLLQFTSDSIGLIILKRSGNKKLAYNVIKTGRDIADTAGSVVGTTIKTGGVLAEGLVSSATSGKVKEAVETVKEKVSDTAHKMDEDIKKSGDMEGLKNRISNMIKEKLDEAGEFKDEAKDKIKETADKIKQDAEKFENKAIITDDYEKKAKDAEYTEDKKKDEKEDSKEEK